MGCTDKDKAIYGGILVAYSLLEWYLGRTHRVKPASTIEVIFAALGVFLGLLILFKERIWKKKA